MKDSLSFVAAVIVSTYLIFIFPMEASLNRQQQMKFVMAQQVMARFVDDVCNKGFLSAAMLQDVHRELAESGLVLDLELKHVRTKYVAKQLEKGEVSTDLNDYVQVEEEYYTHQIHEVLFPSNENEGEQPVKIYYVQVGDAFYAHVKSREPLTGWGIARMFMPTPDGSPAFFLAPYGGLVKNEAH